jgi:hypothetical protein
VARKDGAQARSSRQTRYYRRRRSGLVCVRLQGDAVTLAEFFREGGVYVLAADRATLAVGVEELLRRFELGLLRA